MQYEIQAHFPNGDINVQTVYDYWTAKTIAKRIAQTFNRACDRGDIDESDIPWIWILDSNGEEITRYAPE